MKKYIPVIVLGIIPYGIIFSMVGARNIWDVGIPLGVLLFCLLSITFSVLTSIRQLLTNQDGYSLAKCNMLTKVVQIPAYIVIFLFGVACCVNPIFVITLFLAIIACIVDVVIIASTGLVGAVAVWKNYRENILTIKQAIVLGICQFIFCIDIVAAIVLYVKAKKNH